MKSLLILVTLLATQSAFAGLKTVYPKFNGKNVSKLCYNSENDNFTYTKKTIFGNIKTKTMSRVDVAIGDCTEYKEIENHNGDRSRNVCVEKAKETKLFPLTVKAKTYKITYSGTHGDRQTNKKLVNVFDYDIKDCL